MNDIHDVLVRHADAISDEHRDLRLDEVRARVHTARRQRQALRAGLAACVVLAVALGAVVLPRLQPPDPTPADLVGHHVPERTTSLGYVYRYSGSAVGDDGVLTLDLKASDKPRLVRWASEKANGTLYLDNNGDGDPWISEAGGFGTFVEVPAGEKAELNLNQRGLRKPGRVAMAIYTLDRSAPGVSGGGITFRRSVAGGDLLKARIGRDGQTRLRLPEPVGNARVAVYAFCRGPEDLSFTVTGLGTNGCRTSVPVDLGSDTAKEMAGTRATDLELQVRDSEGSRVTSRKGVRVGLAVYAVSVDGAVESGGHLWYLTGTGRGPVGQRVYSSDITGPTGSRRFLVRYTLPKARGNVVVRFDGLGQSAYTTNDPAGTFTQEVQPPSKLTIRYSQKPRGSIVIRTYQLEDPS